MECDKNKPLYSVKIIFQENWEDYLKVNNVRDIELKEVEKMLSYKGLERGCFIFHCNKCGKMIKRNIEALHAGNIFSDSNAYCNKCYKEKLREALLGR